MKDTLFIKVVLASFAIYLLLQLVRIKEDKLPAAFSEADQESHICVDSTHSTCDGDCFCDGVGCK